MRPALACGLPSHATRPCAVLRPPHSSSFSRRHPSRWRRAGSWHPLTSPLLWQGDEQEMMQGSAPPLTPPWKVLLLSDGSVTRHLQLMTGMRVGVECLEMAAVDAAAVGDEQALPPATRLIPGPLVQRQVLLRLDTAPGGEAYVYATSWWAADTVDEYLRDKGAPIWVSLSERRTELYREILQVQHGHSAYLEGQFGVAGPFWGRSYVFWHGGRPLTVIYEVFSPRLQQFLGPAAC